MPSTIACPACGLTGEVPDGFIGAQVSCPRCGGAIALGNGSPSPTSPPDPRSQVLDAFFVEAFNGRPAGPAPMPLPPRPALSAPPADASAEQQWLHEERQRLEDYLAKQFGVLQHRREELAAWQSRIEAALVAREQELNRVQRQLAAQEESLAQREAAVRDLPELEAKAVALRQEVAEQQELAERHRADADRLRAAAEAAHADAIHLDARLAEWRVRVQQLERRQVALDKAEQAMQRRSGEWEELEDQVRLELEKREQELVRERRVLQEHWQQLQVVTSEKDALRRKLGRLSAELEQLRSARQGV